MVCIYCGADTQVINSRLQKKANRVWRRRKCVSCQGLFTSLEGVDYPTSLLLKKDGKRVEPFQRDILFVSVYESCKHRKHATEAAGALTDTILGKLRPHIHNATLARTDVISVASEVLKRFDKAAYTAYLAYHPL